MQETLTGEISPRQPGTMRKQAADSLTRRVLQMPSPWHQSSGIHCIWKSNIHSEVRRVMVVLAVRATRGIDKARIASH